MSKNGNTFLGILAGSAIGALIGVLFAPEKGSVTRERLKSEALNAKDNLENRMANLESKIKQTVSSEKASLEDKMELVLSDASYKADDLINTLEKKLQELKEKNKKFQKNS